MIIDDTQPTREELIKQRKQFYYLRNRNRMIKSAKKWQQKNKIRAKEIKDTWQRENREKVRKYQKEYRERQKALKINSTNGL